VNAETERSNNHKAKNMAVRASGHPVSALAAALGSDTLHAHAERPGRKIAFMVAD
jgi:hypothetical protein